MMASSIILTKITISQVNFRKSHKILNQFDNSIKSYIKVFEAAVRVKTSFGDIFRNIHFLLATKKSPPEISRQRLISKCQWNLVMKLMAIWWNSYYRKFRSGIWRWFGILGISFFIRFFNFRQMLWLYTSVSKKSVI